MRWKYVFNIFNELIYYINSSGNSIFIWLTIFINKLINKQVIMKKWMLLLYGLDILILLVIIGFIMWMFGYDLIAEANTLWVSVQQGFINKLGALIGTAITIFIAMLVLRVFSIFVRKTSKKLNPNKNE